VLGFLFYLLFDPGDGDEIFLLNIGLSLRDYKAFYSGGYGR
jgi:hypothetical protein